MKKLPVVISIPHGGSATPFELTGRVCLSSEDLFDDGDAYTRDIYDLRATVADIISTDIARAFVDLNRAPNELPPKNPDGVIKSHTCNGKTIYKTGSEPDHALTKKLLEKYYFPYHRRLQNIFNEQNKLIRFALDCHSMAPVAPLLSPDQSAKRPIICLGNFHGNSCPQDMTEMMAACFRQAFSLKDDEVTINRPFPGGYITQRYGGQFIPWIQVELNRVLYLKAPYFDRDTLSVDMARVKKLNRMFEEALRLFFGIPY